MLGLSVPPRQAGVPAGSGDYHPVCCSSTKCRSSRAGRDGKVVSGCVANVGAEVVGLANLFLPHGQQRDKWRRALIATVHDAFPGLPVAAHAHGEDLLGLLGLGFQEIGKMRVWERDAD